jgi:RND family efflux transporter MFP subunit
MKTKVDLGQLVVERGGGGPEQAAGDQRRHLLSRVVLPVLLLAGMAGLLAYAAPDQPADTPLFRAAGWAEPRPTPTVVTALAEGVVDKLLVVEGQQVKQGQVVARLITADARIALDAAEADVKLREGELAAAKVALVAAQTRLERPVHLEAEVAEAKAALARVETEAERLPHLLRAAQSRRRYAQTIHDAMRRGSGSVPEAAIRKAKSDLDEAEAAVGDVESRQKRLPAEVSALKEKRDAVAEKLQRKTDEVRQAREAASAMQIAEARLRRARSLRDAARLRLERMEVRTPISGRVLALIARPGSRLMGLNPRTMHEASSVVTLYDPANLQVRVDVRLDDVGKVTPSQKVKIETAALPGRTLDGEVLAATSQADIQKNTLSVKVAVKDPPSTLKPDMLCQVTFLAQPRKRSASLAGTRRLLVPRSLIEPSGDGARIWVANLLGGTARLRTVRLGLSAGDLVEVSSGVDLTDRLIVGGRDGLKDGDRIRVVGEDETLGINPSAPGKNGSHEGHR